MPLPAVTIAAVNLHLIILEVTYDAGTNNRNYQFVCTVIVIGEGQNYNLDFLAGDPENVK
jgi:hypothetical protein